VKIFGQRLSATTLLPFLVIAAVAGCALRAPTPSAAPPVKTQGLNAGMAEIDITPPIGYRMAGYFEERVSTGTHDPLKAKAMVLEHGDERIALVFCDLVGMSLHVTRAARAEASQLTGIPVTNIIIAATHSHTGPLFDATLAEYFHRSALKQFGYDPAETIDYPKFLTSQLVKVIATAASNAQPAEVDDGIGQRTGLAFNRRYYMRDGSVATNPGKTNRNIIKAAGPVDPDVGIIIVKNRKSEKLEGGLTVFAMHADTTGGTEYSADYPYYLQQALRQSLGSNYISAFGAGTCGDINHIDVSKGGLLRGPTITGPLGRALAETVLDELPHLHPIVHPDIGVRSETLMLPLQKTTPREVAEAKVILHRSNDVKMSLLWKTRAVKDVDLAEKGPLYPMEVQVFRLDTNTAIVCLPAEIFVQFGLAIKKASPFERTMVIALSNDRPSYVPTLQAFKEGSYEVLNSRLAPGAGEKMTEAAIGMLNQLKRDE
jgi:hypothetical protein